MSSTGAKSESRSAPVRSHRARPLRRCIGGRGSPHFFERGTTRETIAETERRNVPGLSHGWVPQPESESAIRAAAPVMVTNRPPSVASPSASKSEPMTDSIALAMLEGSCRSGCSLLAKGLP